MHRQIDQDVNAIRAHALGDVRIADADDVMPLIGRPPQALRHVILALNAGVAVDLDLAVIMSFQQRHDEVRLRLRAKVRRDVTDLQPAIRVAIVVMRANESLQRIGIPAAPAILLPADRGHVIAGVKMHVVDQVVQRNRIVDVQLHRRAETGERPIELRLVLQGHPQSVVRHGHLWIDRDCRGEGFLRLVDSSLRAQRQAEIPKGIDQIGLDARGLIKGGDRLIHLPEGHQDGAEVVMGCRQIRIRGNGRAIGGAGFVRLALFFEDRTEINVRQRQIGLNPQSRPARAHRGIQIAAALKRRREVAVRQCVIRVNCDGVAEGRDRPVKPPLRRQRVPAPQLLSRRFRRGRGLTWLLRLAF